MNEICIVCEQNDVPKGLTYKIGSKIYDNICYPCSREIKRIRKILDLIGFKNYAYKCNREAFDQESSLKSFKHFSKETAE